MAEITYLMGSDTGGSGFYTDAAAYFSARPDATVIAAAAGSTKTLDDVLTDLRTRATAGDTFTVIDLVSQPASGSALSFPVSAAQPGDSTVTQAAVEAALSSPGASGYPEILGAPAISKDTTLVLYGPDIGTDTDFVTLFAQLFGPELTVYAPLQAQDFQGDQPLAVDDGSQFRRTVLSGQLAPSTNPFPPSPPEEPTMAQLYGKYRATVVDANDPMSNGRVQVDIPSAGLTATWAEACLPPVPVSLVQLPPSGATIWVEFEQGDVDRPLWTGVLWGTDLGQDVTIASEGNLALSAKKSIALKADMDVDVSAGTSVGVTAGSSASVSAGTTLDLKGSATVDVAAGAAMDVSAAQVDVSSSVATFSGLVKTDSLVTTSVVSSSYTPGAGNIQ